MKRTFVTAGWLVASLLLALAAFLLGEYLEGAFYTFLPQETTPLILFVTTFVLTVGTLFYRLSQRSALQIQESTEQAIQMLGVNGNGNGASSSQQWLTDARSSEVEIGHQLASARSSHRLVLWACLLALAVILTTAILVFVYTMQKGGAEAEKLQYMTLTLDGIFGTVITGGFFWLYRASDRRIGQLVNQLLRTRAHIQAVSVALSIDNASQRNKLLAGLASGFAAPWEARDSILPENILDPATDLTDVANATAP